MPVPTDTTGMSDQEFLRHYGVGQNLPPGTLPAVQPPASTDSSGIQNALTRYGGAALRGTEWAAPFAAGTLALGATTGPGIAAAAPLAAGELAIGAGSGIVGQAVEDIPGAPSWAGPVAGAITGLAGGGWPTAARTAYNLGGRLVSGPFGGHVLMGAGIGLGELGLRILSGAEHMSSDASALITHGLAALGGTAALVSTGALTAGARSLTRPLGRDAWQAVRDWGPTFIGAVGGAVGPEQNSLAPQSQGF